MKMRVIGAMILAAVSSISGPVQAAEPSKTLYEGFDGSNFTEEGGLYYRENFEQSAGSVEFQSAVKRTGAGALKLSLKPLCPPAGKGCSERAEIWEKTELRVPYNQGVWYGFAVKFADPIPDDDHRYLIAQWKREIDPGAEGDFSPFLALRVRQGKLFATVETNYIAPPAEAAPATASLCSGGSTPVWFRPETNQMRALVATDASWTAQDADLFAGCTDAVKVVDHGNKLPSPASGWIDFAIYTQPGPHGSGRIEIFANGKPVVTVTGHIGHADKGLGENQYFKFGPYRAAHTTEWSLYYDDFRRSASCADVLKDGVCPPP